MRFNVFNARRILGDHGIKPIKRKGQHFVVDPNVAEKQINYADLKSSDLVFEIGTGLGGLTEKIASKGNKLVTIEVDRRLLGLLRPRFGDEENVSLVMADALSFNLSRVNKIISNIPYSLSSQITFKVLELDFDVAILTYQIDFARRMVAKPGSRDYSRLTVNVYYRAEAEILDKIPRNAFYPVPAVDSAIIKLRRREPPFRVEDEAFFFKVLRELFSHRNQYLRKVLKRFLKFNQLTDLDVARIINDSGVRDERIRDIPPESMARLSNTLFSMISR
nr:16S rRNA (adenine(1518)-N(6)/adenine(1519)-N(6))-dimethyltransferase RsmA [Candidatus Njordarchaeum guaymaensis]